MTNIFSFASILSGDTVNLPFAVSPILSKALKPLKMVKLD